MSEKRQIAEAKPGPHHDEGIGRNVFRTTAKELVVPSCLLLGVFVAFTFVSYVRYQKSLPLIALVERNGATILTPAVTAMDAHVLYRRTAEEFVGTLFTYNGESEAPEQKFQILCTAECAAKATKDWTNLRPVDRERQNVLPRKPGVYVTNFGMDKDGVGTCRMELLLERQDLTKNTGIQLYNLTITVKLIRSDRFESRYQQPFIVADYDFKAPAAN